ncbi:hypothetical protein [Nevskia sp.]|uniref:hypothetical protein n=1 Tax=Nevskia sp. TaxID=1929292 RepID=UPI0025D9E22D|nr:hypothetical protein [Nevskia sp.]
MTPFLRCARLVVSLLLIASAPSKAQIAFFTPPSSATQVPERVKHLLDLHAELRAPGWKPDVAFTVRDRDFELPSSVRKACVAGRALTVEIQFYLLDQGRPDVYRGPSIGCFPQGDGLLIHASENSAEKPTRRYWVGSVRTLAEVARYEPRDKHSQQFDRMVRNVLIPIEQGLGLDVYDGGGRVLLARVAEGNPSARLDHFKGGGWFANTIRTLVPAGTVYWDPDYQPAAFHFSDAALAREAVSDAMWRAASWLPPARREVLLWNDGRSFVGSFDSSSQHGTGDFYFPDGLVVRGSINTELGKSDYTAPPELRLMKPGLLSTRWVYEAPSGTPPPAILVHTRMASPLGPPGTYARLGPPSKKNPLSFRNPAELLAGLAAQGVERIDGFLQPPLARDDAPAPSPGIAPFPLVLETDDLPQIATARDIHERLTVAGWTPAQRVEVEDDDKLPKAIRPCGGSAGPVQAVWQMPARSGLREVRIADGACVNGRTRGLLIRATGQVWVGDLAVEAASGKPVAVGKGVEYDPLSGNFLVIDLDNASGAWRAFGDRNGEMIMTLEARGLFITRELRDARLLYTKMLSDGPVVSRLVIPEIGYFDGMSDRANGFIFGGSDATQVAIQPYGTGPGMNLELKGPQFTSFHAIDGSHSVTGFMNRSGDPFDEMLPIGFAMPGEHDLALRKGKDGGWQYRQPVDALRLMMIPTKEAPVRIETHVDTALGPPGRYYASSYLFAPGSLPPKSAVTPEPDTLARIADPSSYRQGKVTQQQLDAIFERLGNPQADAYWGRVFAANEAYNRKEAASYGAEVQKEVAYEQQRRREQAQRDASLARAINGAFADLNRSVESSSRQLQQSQIDSYARQNGSYAPRVMTPEQRALFARNSARASAQFKARKPASGGAGSPRPAAVESAKQAEAEAEQKASEAADKAAAAEGEDAAVLQAEADALKRDAERLESERKAEETRAAEAEAEAQRQELAQAQKREEDERREAEDKRRADEKREAEEKKRQREQEIARSYLPVPEAVSVCVRLDRPEHFRCHSPLAPEGTAVHPQQTSGWRTPQEWNDYLGCKGASSRSLTDGGVYWACGYGVSGITRRDAAESAGVLIQRRTFYCREEENYCRRLSRPAS